MSTETAGGNPAEAYFFSAGQRLCADVWRPPSFTPDSAWPAVVVCHGFGGIKKFSVGGLARGLAAAGFVAATFDYRGFGASEGERNRLFPMEEVADIEAAVTWIGTQEGVDPKAICLLGISFGGGIAIEATTRDPRVRAAVCAVGLADCGRWLRDMRRFWEWREFEARLEADRVSRARTGHSEVVEPEEVMIRDPISAEHNKRLRADHPDWRFRLTLESAEAIARFKPVERVHLVSPRPLMLIGVEEDTLCPYDQTLELHANARDPKCLLTLAGVPHHAIYDPESQQSVIPAIASFLTDATRPSGVAG